MKKIHEIIQKRKFLEHQLKLKKELYSQLDQMSMQSGEGSQAQEEINKIEGSITTLKWVMS